MQSPFFVCATCGVRFPGETRVEICEQNFKVRGEDIAVSMPVRACTTCGEFVSDTTLDDALLTAIHDAKAQSC